MKILAKIIGMMALLAIPALALSAENSVELPRDSSREDSTDIYLMTVGIGDQIYSRFGHTMIRIVDTKRNHDAVYNWGMFDFADPGFAWKFFKGNLLYRVGVQGFSRTLDHYRDFEMRPVWQERLNLTAGQKRKLIERIAWNMRPENVRYPYHYFLNNCATKPRDYLDETLGGVIKESFEKTPGSKTWRQYVRQHMNDNPIVGSGLDVLLSRNVDRNLSQWEEMFYPLKLREYLATLPAVDDNGRPDAGGKMLLDGSVELVNLPDAPLGDRNNFVLAQVLFGVPILFFFVAMVGAGSVRRILADAHPAEWTGRIAWTTLDTSRRLMVRIAQACLGLALGGWALLSGAFGTSMIMLWAFSVHFDAYHNANLWLFWPTDFLLLIVGWRSVRNAFRGHHKKQRPVLSNSVRFYGGLHVMALLTMVSLRKLEFIEQDVDRVLYNMGILGAFIYVAAWFGMMDFGLNIPDSTLQKQVDDAPQ